MCKLCNVGDSGTLANVDYVFYFYLDVILLLVHIQYPAQCILEGKEKIVIVHDTFNKL